MQHFVLNKLPVRPVEILSYKSLQNILETEKTLPWLFITCLDSSDSCPSWQSQRKLAYFFVSKTLFKSLELFIDLTILGWVSLSWIC